MAHCPKALVWMVVGGFMLLALEGLMLAASAGLEALPATLTEVAGIVAVTSPLVFVIALVARER